MLGYTLCIKRPVASEVLVHNVLHYGVGLIVLLGELVTPSPILFEVGFDKPGTLGSPPAMPSFGDLLAIALGITPPMTLWPSFGPWLHQSRSTCSPCCCCCCCLASVLPILFLGLELTDPCEVRP